MQRGARALDEKGRPPGAFTTHPLCAHQPENWTVAPNSESIWKISNHSQRREIAPSYQASYLPRDLCAAQAHPGSVSTRFLANHVPRAQGHSKIRGVLATRRAHLAREKHSMPGLTFTIIVTGDENKERCKHILDQVLGDQNPKLYTRSVSRAHLRGAAWFAGVSSIAPLNPQIQIRGQGERHPG